MKEPRVGLGAFAVILVVCFAGSVLAQGAPKSPAQTKPITLTLISAFSLSVPEETLGMVRFKDEVAKRSGGQVTIEVKGGPEVVAGPAQLKSLKMGVTDMIYTTPMYYAGEAPALDITQYMNPLKERELLVDPRAMGKNGAMDKLAAKYGIKYLNDVHPGLLVYFWTVKEPPLDKSGQVASFRGLKLRAPGTVPSAVVKSLDGIPVSLAPGEMYEALQRKTIDGLFAHPGSVWDRKLYEVVDYLITPYFSKFTGAVMMNMDSFNRLPVTVQELLTNTARDVAVEMHDHFVNRHEELVAKMLAEGKIKKKFALSQDALKTLATTRENILKSFAEKVPELSNEINEIFGPYYR